MSYNCLFLNLLVQLKILSWTQANVCTDCHRIKILVDEVVNDLGKVGLEHCVALGLQGGRAHHGSECVADLLEEGLDLVLGRRVCDELFIVRYDFDADVAGQRVARLGCCKGGGHKGGEEESKLHSD